MYAGTGFQTQKKAEINKTFEAKMIPAGQLESEILKRKSAFGERQVNMNPLHATVVSQTSSLPENTMVIRTNTQNTAH